MSHGFSATYSDMAHSVAELVIVLGNLTAGGHRGGSCACPGVASRVVVCELLVWSSSVCRFEGWADGRPEAAQSRTWRCPVAPGFHNAGDDTAVHGVATQ
jgi:hypothetical protein